MAVSEHSAPQSGTSARVTVASDLTASDLRSALAAGWRDFCAYPAFGLFFSAIYVAGGLALYFGLYLRGEVSWLVPIAAGFPLIAPFAAVGLYEVSRRRELGLPIGWRAILGALRGHGDEQLAMMGIFVFVIFAFWVLLARVIFAIFMAGSGVGGESLSLFTSASGIMMMVIGGGVGAVIALGLFAITVISLPMLVDREVDFFTAMFTSINAVRANAAVMAGWAVLIALLLFAGMVPFFLGLLAVLPVLGHATWHLYRRAVVHPETTAAK